MTFRVGQKVVCVDAEPEHPFLQVSQLTINAIYTVRWVGEYSGSPCIRLDEITWRIGATNEDERTRPFLARRFRPLVEKKTDISIFTAMLGPKDFEPVKVSREVCRND